MPSEATRPNFAVPLGLAWLLVAAWLLVQFWPAIAEGFSDPDDAMRLVQLRAFLAGQGWFDLSEPRVDPPFGYVSHWSRLIDAGLAGLFLLFNAFVDMTLAERLTRAVWPLLWLLPCFGAAAAIAWRIAGREAATIVLVLAVLGLPAFQHFQPGRIDHHNVQIALAMLVVAATAWSDHVRWAAAAAGGLSALAFAIGLESAPFVALAGAALVLRFGIEGGGGGSLVRYGLALATGTVAAFLISVAPAQWQHTACDAIAVNSALPAIAAGLLLAAVGHQLAQASARIRWTGVAIPCGAALLLFVALEPRCLAGPFALVDPAVRPIWLAQVREMEPLAALFRDAPLVGIWISAFPALALIAVPALMRRDDLRRDFGFLLATAALALAAAETVIAVKAYSYAMWFGMPVVAVAALTLFTRLHVPRRVRWLAATVLTPVAISASAITLAQAATGPATGGMRERLACFKAEHYAPLARLPTGVAAADVDFGPLVLALTPHSVLAAPYHRLSHGIVAVQQALRLPPDQARSVLRAAGANYLVLCGDVKPSGLPAGERNGLWASLQSGATPDWLAPIPASDGQLLRIYRIVR